MSKSTPTPPITIDAELVRGRLLITATYASSRGGAVYTTSGHDDGTLAVCDCPGWLGHGKCWHIFNLPLDYFRAQWADATIEALVERDRSLQHWLGLGPDAADEAAARIESTVIGDYIGTLTQTERAA